MHTMGKPDHHLPPWLVAQRQILVGPEVRQLIGYEPEVFFGLAQSEARIAAAKVCHRCDLMRPLEILSSPTPTAGRVVVAHPFPLHILD